MKKYESHNDKISMSYKFLYGLHKLLIKDNTKEWVFDSIRNNEIHSVVDVGCGHELWKQLIEDDFIKVNYFGYDPFIKKNKLPSKHFDCALLIFVLEHLDYGEIAEYFNWFKKQKVKRIIIITENPFNPLIWLWFWNNPSHKRPYPKISIQKIARDFGYSVDVHKFWGLACFQYVELVL